MFWGAGGHAGPSVSPTRYTPPPLVLLPLPTYNSDTLMDEKQYEALLRIPGLKAARDLIARELDQAMRDAQEVKGGESEVGRLSETGRERIAAGQRRRWAKVREQRGDEAPREPRKSKSEAWTPEMRAAQAERIRLARERKVKGAGQGSEEISSDEPESET